MLGAKDPCTSANKSVLPEKLVNTMYPSEPMATTCEFANGAAVVRFNALANGCVPPEG